MNGEYPDDEFTENDVLAALESAGLHFKQGARYILTQCPFHDETHASAQIYKDDWFVNCHAGCGRQHITKAFPELRRSSGYNGADKPRPTPKKNPQSSMKYVSIDLMKQWEAMPLIPRDHEFKGIPLEVLDDLGWRWDANGNRYFIPYFSRSKKSIPFAQWRNLTGNVRFNFWKDAKPTLYGTWNLEPGDVLFLVEGASDAAVLEHCMVPWIAAPSASSGELVRAMSAWCLENDVKLVYAGDNDAAGEKLREAMDAGMSYRVRQPRLPYKDWGDFLEAEGWEVVQKYCFDELFAQEYPSTPEEAMTDIEKIQEIFPGAVQLTMVGGEEGATQAPHQHL